MEDSLKPDDLPVTAAEARSFVIELPHRSANRAGRLALAREFIGAEPVPSAYDEKQEPAAEYLRRRMAALAGEEAAQTPLASRSARLAAGERER